jgi:hypothetical protein
MVILIERFSKSYNKLENFRHHHHEDEAVLAASLQNFRTKVSNLMNKLAPNTRSDFLSVSWVQLCFQMLEMVNKDFDKLVVEIDYPIDRWETKMIEEYLNYSLNLLELLNSVSAELSRLKQARLSLAYALCVVENSPSLAIQSLKPIEPKKLNKEFKEKKTISADGDEEHPSSGKERVVLEALMEVKSLGFWLFGIVLAALSGDSTPYSDMKRFSDKLDLKIGEAILERGFVLKEVREVNEAVNSLAMILASTGKSSDEEAAKLQRRLEDYEKKLDGLGSEVENFFGRALAGRNELLAIIRQKHYQKSA